MAWAWCRMRYDPPIVIGEAEPWNKANAIMDALEKTDAEIVVIADADVWADPTEAIAQVEAGEPWAIPHWSVHRLTKEGTTALLGGQDWLSVEPEEHYKGLEGGGMLVTTRDILQSIPPDPRYEHWGQEDASHGLALYTLLGAPWRGKQTLVHLYHPPQDRLSRRWGSIENKRLFRRYQQARNDPQAMRLLIEESRGASNTSKPARHDLTAV